MISCFLLNPLKDGMKMQTIHGITVELVKRTPLSISKMEDLFKMEGANGPDDDPPGAGNGPPSPPRPSYPSIFIGKDGYDAEKSRNQYIYRGKIGDNSSAGLGIVTYAGDVGGVYVEGSSYTVSDSAVSISGDGDGLGGKSSGAAVGDHGNLTLRDVVITASGQSRCATSVEDFSILRVYNSTLISQGAPFGNDAPADRKSSLEPPAPLEIRGNTRTHVTQANSSSYFYDSTIIGDGWAALSTDDSEGYVYLEANNCTIRTLKDGYGAYADTFCHDVFNNCRFDVAKMAAIVSGESDMIFTDTYADCGSYFVFIHVIGGPPTQVSTVRVKGGKITCVDDAFSIRSHNVILELDETDIRPKNGVLIRSFINPDPCSAKTGGRKVFGIRANIRNMDAFGDILHEDPDRDMYITLQSATLSGAVKGAHLSADMGGKWIATSDSDVTFVGGINLSQVDAPAGVTITAVAAEEGIYDLPGGGRLVVKTA